MLWLTIETDYQAIFFKLDEILQSISFTPVISPFLSLSHPFTLSALIFLGRIAPNRVAYLSDVNFLLYISMRYDLNRSVHNLW